MRLDQDRVRDDRQTKEAILCRIPVFRPVAVKLLRLLQGEDSNVLEVGELLNTDPALSAEVLTMANSAAYTTSNRINTISKAIMMLGTERTKSLATKAALDGMRRAIGNHPVIELCWVHSRATAVIAEWLSPFYRIHPDRAYTAGLMHDVVRLGLLALNCGQYAKLLDCTAGTNEELLAAEQLVFRVDHCTAGLWLMNTWGLPEEFGVACSQHHAGKDAVQEPVADLVRLACALAQATGHKAAPLVHSLTMESLLEEIPDLARPDSPYPLATLSLRLQAELGGPLLTAGGSERFSAVN